MAIATSYLSLIVLPCVRLTEYGRTFSFINSWRNLEVRETKWQYLGEAVGNINQVYVSNSIKEIFNLGKITIMRARTFNWNWSHIKTEVRNHKTIKVQISEFHLPRWGTWLIIYWEENTLREGAKSMLSCESRFNGEEKRADWWKLHKEHNILHYLLH
jgi:hypothetical protein